MLHFNQLVEEEVAVKSMEDETSKEDRVKFLQEAAIMGQFNHPNIIKILGVVVTPEFVSSTESIAKFSQVIFFLSSHTLTDILKSFMLFIFPLVQNCCGNYG